VSVLVVGLVVILHLAVSLVAYRTAEFLVPYCKDLSRYNIKEASFSPCLVEHVSSVILQSGSASD
jgi:hypothetical protein